ncbi:unnamed protein product, partial [marine sediment metagenome]
AFGILLVISLILIVTGIRSLVTGVDIDIWRFLPKGRAPETCVDRYTKNPGYIGRTQTAPRGVAKPS